MKILMLGPSKESLFERKYENKLLHKYLDKNSYPLDDEHIKNASKFSKAKLKFYGFVDVIMNCIYKPLKVLNYKRIIKIDDHDLWSADYTLALIIHPILVKLKEVKHGSPVVSDEDVPEHLRDNDILLKDPNADSKCHEKWEWVLNEMIFAFEHLGPKNATWEREFETGEMGEWTFEDIPGSTFKKMNIDMGNFVSDDEGKQKVRERIKNGLMLFAKYYEGLWD